MTVLELEYFLAVCREKSINKAAVSLFVSQQALSRSIRSLENELGSDLFTRTPTGILLTNFGELFQQKALPVINEFQILRNFVSNYNAQEIHKTVIGMRDSGEFPYSVYRQICRFREIYPSFIVESFFDNQKNLFEGLKNDKYDIALIFVKDDSLTGNGDLYSFIPLKTISACVLVNKASPLSLGTTVSWADLKDEYFVMPEKGDNYGEFVTDMCRAYGFEPKVRFRTNTRDVYPQMVKDGVGITIIPGHRYNNEQPDVIKMEIQPKLIVHHAIAFKKDLSQNPAKSKLIDFLKAEYCKDLL